MAVDPATAALELEAERRAKKTMQRHNQREHWAELHSAVDAMINRVEVRVFRFLGLGFGTPPTQHQQHLTPSPLAVWSQPPSIAIHSLLLFIDLL